MSKCPDIQTQIPNLERIWDSFLNVATIINFRPNHSKFQFSQYSPRKYCKFSRRRSAVCTVVCLSTSPSSVCRNNNTSGGKKVFMCFQVVFFRSKCLFFQIRQKGGVSGHPPFFPRLEMDLDKKGGRAGGLEQI